MEIPSGAAPGRQRHSFDFSGLTKNFSSTFTARKQSLRRLCFYMCLSVILFTGGVYPSMPCRSPGGDVYPSMPCRFPGPHPGGKLRGLARGEGVSRGGLKGVGVVAPGPHLGGLQAATQGGLQGGLQVHTWGCIPACTEADTPPTDSYCYGWYASSWNAFLF